MELQTGQALKTVLQTTPYMLYRLALYGVMCVALFAYIAVLGLIGLVFSIGAFWVLLLVSLGLASALGLWRLLNQYLLYYVEAGHMALATELTTGGSPPMGGSQIGWANNTVKDVFGNVRRHTFLNRRVKHILRDINRKLFDVSAVLPLPGIEDESFLAERIVNGCLPHIVQCVSAHAFRAGDGNIFQTMADGIVLYCQSWKGSLRNAVWLTLWGYAFIIVSAIVLMVPFGIAAVFFTSASVRFILFAAAIFLSFAVKWVFYDALATAAMTMSFLEETDVLTPDPEWAAKARAASERFRQLEGKAEEVRGQTQTTSQEDREPETPSTEEPTPAEPPDADETPLTSAASPPLAEEPDQSNAPQ